jgi:MFS superfamily sulfate permease-like transporter
VSAPRAASGFLFSSLRGYQRPWLRGDLVAGLTLSAVLVPQALAYASIAQVSPVVGLYAAPGALLLYAVLGSSRVLVVGPMAAVAALSAATVADLAPVGEADFAALTAGLALTTGAAALIAGLLRLGFLANFISPPVLKGFIIGLALTIVIGQLPKLFGIAPGTGDFFEQLWRLVTHLGDTQALTLLVGGLSLALIIGMRRVAPGFPARSWPSPRRSRRSRRSASTFPPSVLSPAACHRSACPTSASETPARWPPAGSA